MQASIFIVHRNDGLLRAIAALLVSERYRVRSAETIGALADDLTRVGGPAVLLIDEDAGRDWRERSRSIPDDIPRVILTWDPRGPFPPGVTPLGKPFRARELLDALSRSIAARAREIR